MTKRPQKIIFISESDNKNIIFNSYIECEAEGISKISKKINSCEKINYKGKNYHIDYLFEGLDD